MQRRKSDAPLPISPKSILFIELTRLGDVVTMLPAIRSFREAYPGAALAVAVQDQYAGLLNCFPSADAVYPLSGTQTIYGLLRASFRIPRGVDLICSMSPGIRNSYLTLAAPARWKIGYLTSSDSLTPFLDEAEIGAMGIGIRPVPPYSRESITRRPEKILDALGIPAIPGVPGLLWNIPEAMKAGARLKACGEPPYIVLHPFALWRYREWSVEKYLSMADALGNGHTVVIAGTTRELARAELPSLLPAHVRTFDASDLAEYLGLLVQSSLFIGSDSGPLHLAASAGIPCIGLFGPATPEFTAPRYGHCTAIYHAVECSPCRQDACIHPERPCMSLIGMEEVAAAAQKMLRREPALTR